jgi:hypothetical protein
MVKFWAAFVFACSLILGSVSCNSSSSSNAKSELTYTVPNEITLTASASRDETDGTVISGTTNLPNGTKLGVELMSKGRATSQDFDVIVAAGNFRSAPFRKGTSPISPGRRRLHIFTYFTNLWQSPTVLNLVGNGGSKLKASGLVRAEDAQLIDADKVLDYAANVIIPPLGSGATQTAAPTQSSAEARQAKAIEIVKKAVLVVDGDRSSMNVEDGVLYYFGFPGIRMGTGWSATQTADNTFNVVLDAINSDGKGKEWHEKAIWEVNVVTKKVLYRTKMAKAFSWIPDK